MPIRVRGIHHHAVRIDARAQALEEMQAFYTGVLGLAEDKGRPDFPGVPGLWMNVGAEAQLHLIGGALASPVTDQPGLDPTAAHVALAVEDVLAAKAELERLGINHWSTRDFVGPEQQQIFLQDPSGNLIELHQYDSCRCAAANRQEER